MKTITIFLLGFAVFSCSKYQVQKEEKDLPQTIEEAVDSSTRSSENEDRDEYQHPEETLQFFGVRPEMTVVEIDPGAGYYTEILAPYLAKEGQYVMAVPRVPSHPPAFMIENERKLQDILLRNKAVQVKTKFMAFEPQDKKKGKFNFADMVLSFSHVHNWVAHKVTNESFKFCYDVLRPGGILGIVQHRISDKKKKIPKSGYMTEKEVIFMAQSAGLRYLGRSNINANPKDKADYPKGVWTLPPTYRLGETDKDKYESIGESDKMTLKFVKPK